MSTDCIRFRTELEDLAGASGGLARLARDPHARACPACGRELARASGLERLLARVPAPAAPPGLARRVLAGLASERHSGVERAPGTGERELEELLEALPEPATPPGLSERVLLGLAPARGHAQRRVRAAWLWLAAAGLLATLALWAWRQRGLALQRAELVLEPAEELEADEELLAYAVERWELLHDEDLDVWLASLDPILIEQDEFLVEFADGESWLQDAPAEDGAVENDAGEPTPPARRGD